MSESKFEYETTKGYLLFQAIAGELERKRVQYLDDDETVAVRRADTEQPLLQIIVDGKVVTTVVMGHIKSTGQLGKLIEHHKQRVRDSNDDTAADAAAWH